METIDWGYYLLRLGNSFNFLASLINGNSLLGTAHRESLWAFNFLASLINGNVSPPRDINRRITF